MTSSSRRLLAALALSLVAHALPFVTDLAASLLPRPAQRPPPLQAQLRLPLPTVPEVPLLLPDPPPQTPPRALPPPTPRPAAGAARATRGWQEEVRRQWRKRDEKGLFYPEEAIARGLEGVAIVLLVLDPGGNAVAVRLEETSGHAILDDAALRAAGSLRSLPADAPRETLIPVRFRLR